MGVSSSPAELARKLNGFAKDMSNVQIPLEATALHVKRLFETSAASSGALGATMSGKRKTIGARYDVKGSGQTASAVVFYTGPAHLLNNPTSPHRIEPRRARGSRSRRRGGASVLVINGSVRAYANHPGTRGKGFFQQAKTVAQATAPRVYAQKGLTEPLRRNF
jgi:hypothetical protein